MYLAYFPLAFSAAIFAIPLFRLPVNMVKNLRRRRDNLRHLAMLVIDEQSDTGEDLYSFDDILNSVNHYLDYLSMPHATTSELSSTLEDLMDDFNAKHKVHKENAKHYYQFDTLVRHQKTARLERDARGLDKQDLGRVIFSTDAEDVDAEKNANDIEFEDFDKSLESKPKCLNA